MDELITSHVKSNAYRSHLGNKVPLFATLPPDFPLSRIRNERSTAKISQPVEITAYFNLVKVVRQE
jgi:hypothetical protein